MSDFPFRTQPRADDVAGIERLVRKSGVFSEAETGIAIALIEQHLAGEGEGAGFHFLFADGVGGLEGYTCFGPIEGTVNRHMLYWIVVDRDGARGGLGRRLQQASEAAAKALGAEAMVAETSTRPDYLPARRFYEAVGYRLVADIPDWHADGDGMAVYWKRL